MAPAVQSMLTKGMPSASPSRLWVLTKTESGNDWVRSSCTFGRRAMTSAAVRLLKGRESNLL